MDINDLKSRYSYRIPNSCTNCGNSNFYTAERYYNRTVRCFVDDNDIIVDSRGYCSRWQKEPSETAKVKIAENNKAKNG